MDRFDFFSRMARSTPGGATFTSAYLTQVQIKATDTILDLDCGAGDRATWVARSRGCRVLAVDQDPRYLAVAASRAEEGGASEIIDPICANYGQLPFEDNAFRVIISESGLFSLGLKQGLTLWRRLLSPQGHLCIAYPGVVKKDSPAEVREPLEARMVEPLGTLSDYHATIRAAGYEVVHQVPLQPELWDAFHTGNVRRAWSLVSNGQVPEDDPTINEVLDQAKWFRRAGRGRVFLQAMVLRRVR